MSATWATIRAAIETAIEAITPGTPSDRLFRAADDTDAIEDWSEANADACFRRYTVRKGGDVGEGTTNMDLEQRRCSAEVVVAYPTANLGQYGLDNRRSMDDVIDADGRAIDSEIGVRGSVNYAGSVYSQVVESRDVERTDAVTLLRLPITIIYEEAA